MQTNEVSMRNLLSLSAAVLFLTACTQTDNNNAKTASTPAYDTVITNGLVYNGLGGEPFSANIGISGDRIAAVGDLDEAQSKTIIDAKGMAVAPGFINMLSWAPVTLIEDGRGLSDIKQGVTLEVFGEGRSMGPWNDAIKAEAIARQDDIKYDIEWTSLGDYFDYMEARGISPNIASYVGATTVRVHEIGAVDRPPTPEELDRMKTLVSDAMQDGALGVGSSLIYAPAFYADTDELIALVDIAQDYGGSYITHMRSEGARLLEAVDEVLEIADATGAGVEIYHLKASGRENWDKLDAVIEKINTARARGVDIRADMYTYTAGATGLDAAMPPWVQEGGHDAWVERLKDPAIRARLLEEIDTPTDEWENLYLAAGGAENVLFIGFKNPALKPLTGKTLAQVSAERKTTPAETIIDLVIEDDSRVDTVYFLMSEENVAKKAAQPWMSFGSDEGAYTPEGVFLLSGAHPRAYGTFARVLGKYARDEGVMPLAEAIRKLTSFPAANLKIRDRGQLKEGYYADIVIFDPEAVRDLATYAEPHQLSTGVAHVWVNGEQVLRDGEHTGALPGRAVRGPGWTGWDDE
jgi:N-acyl-D-aspartate/D-glutamate deacylase